MQSALSLLSACEESAPLKRRKKNVSGSNMGGLQGKVGFRVSGLGFRV